MTRQDRSEQLFEENTNWNETNNESLKQIVEAFFYLNIPNLDIKLDSKERWMIKKITNLITAAN